MLSKKFIFSFISLVMSGFSFHNGFAQTSTKGIYLNTQKDNSADLFSKLADQTQYLIKQKNILDDQSPFVLKYIPLSSEKNTPSESYLENKSHPFLTIISLKGGGSGLLFVNEKNEVKVYRDDSGKLKDCTSDHQDRVYEFKRSTLTEYNKLDKSLREFAFLKMAEKAETSDGLEVITENTKWNIKKETCPSLKESEVNASLEHSDENFQKQLESPEKIYCFLKSYASNKDQSEDIAPISIQTQSTLNKCNLNQILGGFSYLPLFLSEAEKFKNENQSFLNELEDCNPNDKIDSWVQKERQQSLDHLYSPKNKIFLTCDFKKLLKDEDCLKKNNSSYCREVENCEQSEKYAIHANISNSNFGENTKKYVQKYFSCSEKQKIKNDIDQLCNSDQFLSSDYLKYSLKKYINRKYSNKKKQNEVYRDELNKLISACNPSRLNQSIVKDQFSPSDSQSTPFSSNPSNSNGLH